ncbi:MAG: transposase [Saprospiraceae bacterium]
MGQKRRTFSAKQKSKIALDAIKERMTASEIAKKYLIHPNQVSKWKSTALDGLEDLFLDKRKSAIEKQAQEELTDKLYRQVGKLQMELEWLKKKVGNL